MSAEELFQELLSRAEEVADFVEDATPWSNPGTVRGDDFPFVTLAKLLGWAATQYRAALLLLSEPVLAHSAELQCRATIEAWAHAFFICTDDGTRGYRRRALCFELGQIRDQERFQKRQPSLVPPEVAQRLAETCSALEKLHTSEGCECKGRNNRAVGDTLESISEFMKSPVAKAFWNLSSMYGHALLPERAVKDAPGMLMIEASADYTDRGVLLARLLTSFAEMSRLILDLVNPAAVDAFTRQTQALSVDKVLTAAWSGELDAKGGVAPADSAT